jgi:hypothetical protein
MDKGAGGWYTARSVEGLEGLGFVFLVRVQRIISLRRCGELSVLIR